MTTAVFCPCCDASGTAASLLAACANMFILGSVVLVCLSELAVLAARYFNARVIRSVNNLLLVI